MSDYHRVSVYVQYMLISKIGLQQKFPWHIMINTSSLQIDLSKLWEYVHMYTLFPGKNLIPIIATGQKDMSESYQTPSSSVT